MLGDPEHRKLIRLFFRHFIDDIEREVKLFLVHEIDGF